MKTPDLAQLAVDLDSQDAATRLKAASAAQSLGEEARPLGVALVRRTGDGEEEIREAVIAALEDLGPPRPEDLGALAALLRDPCAAVGYWAATLVGRLGPAAAPAVGPLVDALTLSSERSVRERAAWALGEIGPAAGAAREALRAVSAKGEPRLARLASAALAKISG